MVYQPLAMVESNEMVPCPMPSEFPRLAALKLPARPAEPKPESTSSTIWHQEGIRQWSLTDRQSGIVMNIPTEHFMMVKFTFANGKSKQIKVALTPEDAQYNRETQFLIPGKQVNNWY